ncbi:MAG: hypothetical protein FWG83_04505 [Oscillospiraceae bacterium]|nr:hypothetical protein [Oscillospiraceae bacterium]
MILPEQDKLVIPLEKLTKYALDAVNEPDKAIAFKLALGFCEGDEEILIQKIKSGITIFNAKEKNAGEWGQRYQVIIRMRGLNGKTANVLTAWIHDVKNNQMRLTSVYITKKEVLEDDKYKTI